MAKNWISVISDFIRHNPKVSAAVAFNLGVAAARASKRGRKFGNEVIEIPSKLIELVPSVKDLGAYVPLLGNSRKPAKRKRRASARRAVARPGRKSKAKTNAKTRTRRKAAS